MTADIAANPTFSAGNEASNEVARLAQAIDVNSLVSIQAFGAELSEKTAAYSDEMLANARSGDLDETGAQLNRIVLAAKAFDLEAIDKALSKTPLLGGLFKFFAMSKEKAMAQFASVKAQVDALVASVESTAARLGRRNHDYQSMYESVKAEHGLLGLHIKAIEMRLADVDGELVAFGAAADAGDTISAMENRAVLEAARNALSKRADDLTVLQHAAMQMLPMVRIMQSNNLALLDKFETIRRLTLPAWKRAFMLTLALEEQKGAVALATTIDDATNDLMRRNAALLHQNSVATAKANQRLVVDIATLREVHDTVLRTLADVRKAHAEGAEERRGAIAELDRLRREMADGVRAMGVADEAA